VYIPATKPVAVSAVPAAGLHAYTNGPVPPLVVCAALPLFSPLHNTFAVAAAAIVNTLGCVTTVLVVAEHPWASFTVTVYVPAVSFDTDCVVAPPGNHAYVYGLVPPFALSIIIAFFPPLHDTFVNVYAGMLNAFGWVIVTAAVTLVPQLSLSVTVYTPDVNPLALAPEPPDGAHAYVYAVVPPLAVTLAAPPLPALQLTSLVTLVAIAKAAGCVTVTATTVEHPWLSVTVTLYVPADKLLAVAFVLPPVQE
jgi:hypothetical protein